MAEIQFCPESIVSEIFSKVGKEENKENRENQNHARIASTADILQQLNQNVIIYLFKFEILKKNENLRKMKI